MMSMPNGENNHNGDSGNIGANDAVDDPLETMTLQALYNGANGDINANGDNGVNGENNNSNRDNDSANESHFATMDRQYSQ